MEPLVDEDQLSSTKALIKEFGKAGGLGEKLQEKLEQRANKMENWVRRPLKYLIFGFR